MKWVGKIFIEAQLIGGSVLTTLQDSSLPQLLSIRASSCTARWKYKPIKALVKTFCPESYSMTFQNWDLSSSIACFTCLLTLGIVLIAPGATLPFILFSERIPSVPPNHTLIRLLHCSPKSYTTHMPDQLLAVVTQAFKLSYCATNSHHAVLPFTTSCDIYQKHFQITCSFYQLLPLWTGISYGSRNRSSSYTTLLTLSLYVHRNRLLTQELVLLRMIF